MSDLFGRITSAVDDILPWGELATLNRQRQRERARLEHEKQKKTLSDSLRPAPTQQEQDERLVDMERRLGQLQIDQQRLLGNTNLGLRGEMMRQDLTQTQALGDQKFRQLQQMMEGRYGQEQWQRAQDMELAKEWMSFADQQRAAAEASLERRNSANKPLQTIGLIASILAPFLA